VAGALPVRSNEFLSVKRERTIIDGERTRSLFQDGTIGGTGTSPD